MTIPTFRNVMARAFAAIAFGALAQSAFSDSGTWSVDSDGNWSDASKWAGSVVADGSGNTADFSTVDLTGNRTVTLDTARTISALIFGDAAAPGFNWTLNGPNALTLGAAPVINVVNQNLTIAAPLNGTAGLTKIGSGTLTFLGTNSYTGTTLISNGVVNFNGASKSTSGGVLNVGGVAGRAVLNISGTASLTNNGGSYNVGGLQGNSTDTGVGVINIASGSLNNGNNNNYTEIGTGSANGNALSGPVTYGFINLTGGNFNTLGSSGIRVGAGGIGILNQTGGTLNCSRWFAVGSQHNGANDANAGGIGVVNFLGGTANIASGNRIILNDKSGSVGILNLGTSAGGTATVAALNSNGTQGGIDFLDQGGTAGKAILNLNSGTLRLSGPMYRNNAGGSAEVNWNGGTLQLNANMSLVNTANSFPAINVFNRGAVIDTQGNNVTSAAQFVQPGGNGIYPAGGIVAIPGNGGANYLGQPLVTISGGSGSGAKAIANVSGGIVTGVALTCPGQNYFEGDQLTFTFTGGGAATAADAFNYTLSASDLAANNAGGLTKFGLGKLTLSGVSTYAGETVVGAGTLDVTVDSGLGVGNVSVAGGATLILETGALNDYVADSANVVISSSGLANLNFSGTDIINGLSLDGGATYVAPGTYGSSSSGAAHIDDTHFTGTGVFQVTTTPEVTLTVVLQSSINPSVLGQSVTLTATITSTGGGTPSGTVTFKEGTAELGTASLNGSGQASLVVNDFAVGSHTLTATYTSVTSQILVQTVNIPTDVWTGSASSIWDIDGALNWSVGGIAAKYQEGNYVQLDDTATGSTAIDLDTIVHPGSLVVSNNVKSYSISGNGGIAGATGLVKAGAGSLTLNTANSYTGATAITNGVVIFAESSANTGNGSLLVGNGDGRAVLNVATTNALTFDGELGVGGRVGTTTGIGAGAINQTSGTFNSRGGGNAYIELGSGGLGAYGAYTLVNGEFNTINNSGVRVGASGVGIYFQSGGVLDCGRYFAIGTQSGVNDVGGTGVATFIGGSATFSPNFRVIVGDKIGSSGVLNIGTTAGGDAVLTQLRNSGGLGGIEFLDNTAANSGVINLNSGVLKIGGAIYRPDTSTGTPALNFNGGTLQAGGNNINLITNVHNEIFGDLAGMLFSRGLTVDTLENNCFISADLLAAQGDGVYPASGWLTVTDGGSGYIGAPLVTVSGGSGFGAMAVAQVSNGSVASVALTCAGQYYQAGDTLFFDFTSGGAIVPAGTFSYTLQPGDLLPNANGGLIKIGSGALALTGLNNSYAGETVVSNGTLFVAGNLSGGGVVSVRGGVLGGTGSISGPVNVDVGGTLTAGLTNTGVLTINNELTFASGATFSAKIDKGSATQDLIQGLAKVTYAGTLTVTNLSGFLAINDSFKLFDAAVYEGSFSAVVPVTPGLGLAWDTTQLAVDGTLRIVEGSSVNPDPTNITFKVSGGQLELSWPQDHIGWRLQAQTNSLSTGLKNNWVDVADSIATNRVFLPISRDNGAVFFRLIY